MFPSTYHYLTYVSNPLTPATSAGNAKKADLVTIFEREVAPKAEKLLAKRTGIRASSRGIEDFRSEQPAPTATAPKSAKKRLPMSVSTSQLSKGKASRAAEPLFSDAEDDMDDAMDVDEVAPLPRSRKTSSNSLTSSRKSASMGNLASVASGRTSSSRTSTTTSTKARRTSASPGPDAAASRPSGRGMRRSASVELVNIAATDDDDELPSTQAGPTSARRRPAASRSRRSAASPALSNADMDIDEEPTAHSRGLQPVVEMSSPRESKVTKGSSPSRRTIEVVVPASRRKSSAADLSTSPAKRKAKAESSDDDNAARRATEAKERVAESGFSDYNPFQSGDDATPDRSKKRRKSSMGVSNGHTEDGEKPKGMQKSATISSLADYLRDSPIVTAPAPSKSERRQSSPSKSAASSSQPTTLAEQAKKRAGLPSSKSMPSFKQPPALFESLQTAPEDFKLIVRKADEEMKSLAPPKHSTSGSQRRQSSPLVTSSHIEDQQILDDLADEPALDDTFANESPAETQQVSATQSTKSQRRLPAPATSSSPPREVVKASEQVVVPKSRRKLAVSAPTALAVASLPLLSAFGWAANRWLDQKQQLGFCDTGSTTNAKVQLQHARLAQTPHVVFGDERVDGPLRSIIDQFTPISCGPCPAHAVCSNGNVDSCTRDYILRPHKVAYLLGDGIDASKSVLPLLLHPQCKPDTERLMRVAELASQIAKYLRHVRGDIICSGEERARIRAAKKNKHGKVEDWSVYGLSEDFVKKIVFENRNVSAWRATSCITRLTDDLQPKIDETAFDSIFSEALGDLISHNEVVHGVDHEEGEPWIAATIADMPLGCRTRLAAYQAASDHKGSLAGLAALLLSAAYGRLKLSQRRHIAEQVEELVPIALTLLQQQEQNHHIDNVLTPYPYLAPSQLRDLVLAHEHSPARRAELWQRVEKIIEGNSNVRAKTAEQYGEDMRVWQWVGAAYSLLDDDDADDEPTVDVPASVRRRRSLVARPSLSRPGTPRMSLPNRHITWSKDVKASPVQSPAI